MVAAGIELHVIIFGPMPMQVVICASALPVVSMIAKPKASANNAVPKLCNFKGMPFPPIQT
jgi:hypothetical protein